MQPGALLAGRPVHVRLCEVPGPLVLWPVEVRRIEPVLPGELTRILDPQSALLGAVDEEQATERPERLASERLLGLLLDEEDALARSSQLGRCDEARETGSDDDCIGGALAGGGVGPRGPKAHPPGPRAPSRRAGGGPGGRPPPPLCPS